MPALLITSMLCETVLPKPGRLRTLGLGGHSRPAALVLDWLRRGLRWLGHQGPIRVLLIYRDSAGGDYAASLAFYALVTMFPIFLGLLTLLGLVSRNEDLDLRLQAQIVDTFPLGVQLEVQGALVSLRKGAAAYGLIAIAWLLWSGTGYFAHLELGMNRIYVAPNRSFWKQRLMGVGMICSLSTSIAVGAAGSWVLGTLLGLSVLGFVANWLILTALLLSMYHVVPNRRLGLHESWPGAVLASTAIQVLNLGFPIYLRLTHNFNAFGRGLLFFLVLVTWLYLVSQVLLLGAVLNRLQVGRIPDIGRSYDSG
ncbi:MAG: YihY/virulence factor BrkB family protein [Candidatus Dormibacteraeota bacterium]|nr:YihY/virulence factor BrkB family protein [Candidatus Dormibacteraeota bacterium]